MAGSLVGPETRTPADSDGAPAEYWTLAGTVKGPLAKRDTEALAEQDQASIADPIPLGLAGFAAATFTVSSVFAWFNPSAQVVAIPVLLVFGGITQFLAGMWAYRRGNVIAATAFGSFGAFNTAFAILLWMAAVAHVTPPLDAANDASIVAGIFVLTFGLIAAYLGIAALGDNRMIAAILFVLAFTYLCDGVGLWIAGRDFIGVIGGYAGMLVSLMAFYESAAIVINSGIGTEVLPTFAVRRPRVSYSS